MSSRERVRTALAHEIPDAVPLDLGVTPVTGLHVICVAALRDCYGMTCGTDFGTQTSSFCSVDTFRDLWFPYFKRVNDWIHENTGWKIFEHSCGPVERFLGSFVECGFDIINPVQCSAANMEPERLKAE